MFEIEKNIPIPKKKPGAPGQVRQSYNNYHFRSFELGDSIFVPVSSDEDLNKYQTRLAVVAGSAGKRHKPVLKFTTRRVEGGIRIWRVS